MSVSWFEFTKNIIYSRKQLIDEDKENMVNSTDSKDEPSRYVLIL